MHANNQDSPLDLENFASLIHQSRDQWIDRQNEIQQWVSELPLLLFGFGGKGQTLACQIRDLTGRSIAVYDTSPIKREAAKAQGFSTINDLSGMESANWLTILGACQAQIEQKQTINTRTLFFQEAASFFGAPHLAYKASDFGDFVFSHVDEHYQVYLDLQDESRDRFLTVLCFRVSNDPTLLQKHRQPVSEMWLDMPQSLKNRSYNTFLDVGAYDGDTLGLFRHRFNCTKGIAVEANTALFDSIHKVAVNYVHGIDILPMAAWSKNTRLNFQEVRGGMIQVTESIDGELNAAPIDQFVHEQVDCIKMDVEGAESEALAGCSSLLLSYRPDLAIAAYHRPQDLVELNDQIKRAGYTQKEFIWHLGHYSDCLDDSILYILRA